MSSLRAPRDAAKPAGPQGRTAPALSVVAPPPARKAGARARITPAYEAEIRRAVAELAAAVEADHPGRPGVAGLARFYALRELWRTADNHGEARLAGVVPDGYPEPEADAVHERRRRAAGRLRTVLDDRMPGHETKAELRAILAGAEAVVLDELGRRRDPAPAPTPDAGLVAFADRERIEDALAGLAAAAAVAFPGRPDLVAFALRRVLHEACDSHRIPCDEADAARAAELERADAEAFGVLWNQLGWSEARGEDGGPAGPPERDGAVLALAEGLIRRLAGESRP